MATVLIRGANDSSYHSDRIAAAIACVSSFEYKKSVLILPMTTKFKVEEILSGKRMKQSSVSKRGYAFDDSGMDGLIRRAEQGTLTADAFSDCCIHIIKEANSFDIAKNTSRPDLAEFIIKNESLISQLVRNANVVYNEVILLADTDNEDTLKALERISEKEVTVIPQGNKREFSSKSDSILVINDYDQSSVFTYKHMKEIYKLRSDVKLYPIPYNIAFKDACRTEKAIDYFSANVKLDKSFDDNYNFITCVSNLVRAIIGGEEPVVEELSFSKLMRAERRQNKTKK